MDQGCPQLQSECEHGSADCDLRVGLEVKRGSRACFMTHGSLAWYCALQNNRLMLLVSYVQPQWARDGERWNPQHPVSPASFNLEPLATSDIGRDSDISCWPKGWAGGS